MDRFPTIGCFKGKWTMRNGRQVKFVSNIKEMLFDLGAFPIILATELWDNDGNSKVNPEFDLIEKIREAKDIGMNL